MSTRPRWPRQGSRVALLLLPAAVTLASGCGKREDEPKYIQREGRVASISKETGIVEMWYYHPKQKEEVKIAGTLDPNAEILINGILATIDEVRPDDKVKVTGKAVKQDGERRFIALKVEIDRPEPESAPASEPAPTSP